MLPPEDSVVVGWYRSDPTGKLKISASDHAAHVGHFSRPWQVVLLLTSGPSGTRGGLFRPAGEFASPVPYLPFYELLDPESYRDDGRKQPRVSWSNYWSPDSAVWRAHPDEPRAPRITPSERPSGARRHAPILMDNEDDEDRPSRLPRRAGVWGWLILAAGAVVAAVALGLYLGLRPETPPLPPPAGARARSGNPAAPQSRAGAAARQPRDVQGPGRVAGAPQLRHVPAERARPRRPAGRRRRRRAVHRHRSVPARSRGEPAHSAPVCRRPRSPAPRCSRAASHGPRPAAAYRGKPGDRRARRHRSRGAGAGLQGSGPAAERRGDIA